jgi:hypothetical protein
MYERLSARIILHTRSVEKLRCEVKACSVTPATLEGGPLTWKMSERQSSL